MTIATLLGALNERTIARDVAIPHDETRMRFSLSSNTVGSIDEFFARIGEYYSHHHSLCVSKGGKISPSEARSLAKEIVEREYRRHRGNIVSAFNNAHDGTNGGLRAVLDIIAESLKAQAVENYVRDVFDSHVAPDSWEQQVQIIGEFVASCGPYLSSEIRVDQPERYARNYEELIRAYVEALKSTSSMFRRL